MTNMIELTVKTLDSQNHQFNVADEMTVKDFKAEISPRIGIPAEQQRLIFRGRVLQDEKKLKECNVANNTVHVVIRPANASSNRNNDQPSARTNNERGAGEGQGGIIITGDTAGGGGRNAIIMGAIGLPSIDIQVQNSIADARGANSSGSRTRNNAAFRLQGPSGGGAQSVAQNMNDEDIDDMLNLTSAPRRPRTQISMDSSSSNFDTALKNIPSKWVDTVRHDLHRQLGMPDQPPFSPGYTALLSRKP